MTVTTKQKPDQELSQEPKYTTACPDWEKRIVAGKSIIPEPIFPDTAERALNIFKALRVVDLPGQPTFGEISAPWVFDFVKAIFGAYDVETGKQHIRNFLLMIAKKNTKALALDTPIATPDGWSTMGELEAGDYIFGADGNPTRVISTSEVFLDSDCYEITFSNGEKVIASGDHQWLIEGGVYDTYSIAKRGAATLVMKDARPPVKIIDCIPIETVPTKCIAVDAADKLFLCGKTMLPTHNSTIAAGVMLTALIQCWRYNEEHLILAPTKEVADNSFTPATGMIRADPALNRQFRIREHMRIIENKKTKSSLRVVAADSKVVTGKKAGRVLIDELHEFGTMARATTILQEASGGQVSRPEGFVIYLTTQGSNPPAGVFREQLRYFRQVRDGDLVDNRSLPIIYEYPQQFLEDKKHLDPKNFGIVNPNIGRSVDEEWLEAELKRVTVSADQERIQGFLSKHLNVEMGLALKSDRWAGADLWEDSELKEALTLEDLITQSEVITVGIDGGGLDDLLGLYVLGRRPDGVKIGWGCAWVHKMLLSKRPDIASKLTDYSIAGEVFLVEGKNNEDILHLAEICAIIESSGKLDKIGVDHMGLGSIEEALAAEGVEIAEYIVTIPQGWRLSASIKNVERWLSNRQFKPAKQDFMRWCVGNAKVEQRGNNVIITKQQSGVGKIDTVIALLNAAAIMALNPPAKDGMASFMQDPLYI